MHQPEEPGFALALMDRLYKTQLEAGGTWIRPQAVSRIRFMEQEMTWVVRVIDNTGLEGYVPCGLLFDYISDNEVTISRYE